MRFRSTFVQEGAVTTAVLEADSEFELAASLRDSGRTLVRARALAESAEGASGPRLSPRRLLLMTQSLDSLIKGGVPLLGAFQSLRTHEEHDGTRRIYDALIENVSKGRPISDAMAAQPRAFPKLYSELVRAGETTGSLEQVFGYLAGFLDWMQDIRGTIKKAAVYPVVVLSASFGLVLFLLSFVVPRLSQVIMKIADDLPPATRALIGLSDFVAGNLAWILVGSFASAVGLFFFVRSTQGERFMAELLVRVPVTRAIVLAIGRAQICRTLSVMLESGIPLTDSLAMVAGTVRVRRLSDGLRRCRELLTRGESVTHAFDESRVLPGLPMALVSAGEESGDLPSSLRRLSEFYDRDAHTAVDRGVALLEPATTIMLGGIVAAVAGIILNTLYGAMQGVGA